MSSRPVPFFVYPNLFAADEAAHLEVIREVCSRGAFIMQRDKAEFEQRLADYLQARHAIGVANATDGLEIALRAAGLQAGDEVILCSHTMLATGGAVAFAGGTPVPVDMADDHLVDLAAMEAAITPRTTCLMPTQLNGRCCNMDRLQTLADQHGLFIVEDAAQALGARFKGRCAGTFGTASAISFYPAKVLGCFGDAGGLICDDDAVYERAWCLHDHGRRPGDGEVLMWGRNSRLDNLQAAILNHRFQTYDAVVARRRALAALYQERLGRIAALHLPPAPDASPDHFDIYQNYELEAERRDQLKAHLTERGIGTLIQWGGSAVHQFRRLGFTCRLPRVERFFEHCLMLPMRPDLSDDDAHFVCDQICAFYGEP
jgi:dTDP-4-amino-4,6-dideoxygalactose transaminase